MLRLRPHISSFLMVQYWTVGRVGGQWARGRVTPLCTQLTVLVHVNTSTTHPVNMLSARAAEAQVVIKVSTWVALVLGGIIKSESVGLGPKPRPSSSRAAAWRSSHASASGHNSGLVASVMCYGH